MNKAIIISATLAFGLLANAETPYYLNSSPYDVVVPILNGDPSNSVAGQFYYDVSQSTFKAVNNSGAIEKLLTSNNVGTTANKIVQLDGSGRLPAVDGSQLTNLPSSANTTLSNLAATTAINSALLPVSTSFLSLGSSSKLWSSVNSRNLNAFDSSENLRVQISGSTNSAPDGTPVNSTLEASWVSSSSNQSLSLNSANASSSSAVATGSVIIASGNRYGGTGNSGNIKVYVGTSEYGARGKFKIVDGTEGTVGNVWTSVGTDGAGNWAAPKSPTGTLCGWNDGTLVVNCKGTDPSVSCPTGYTQKNSSVATFCSAN